MKILLAWFALAAVSCSLYTDDPVLTDRDAAAPTADAEAPRADAAYSSCAVSPHCPPPTSDSYVTMCGPIVDTETGEPVAADGWSGVTCDPDAPTADGPCALRVRFVDMLGFVANPTGTDPLSAYSAEILDCGEFRGIDIEVPFSGQVGIVIDGAPGTPATVVPTMVVAAARRGERNPGARAYATRATTDAAWTATAGHPFGDESFADRGVIVARFDHRGAPVPGVAITAGGNLHPSSDYYFDETETALATIDPARDVTGANGAGLLVDAELGDTSGAGGLPGCEWNGELAATPPGVVSVIEPDAFATGGGPCP